ncbi:unnamed protein product [Moneuplotes crassus]|uniref:Uncharacterized protein n=1 Tax=Euplotes crassus TaxID=5936 RepID=A0AAD1Y2H3_EUPCR|nr:unnamed protein product [Moneuplotes crassus]
MEEYMSQQEIMKARTNKLLKEAKFSEVDGDLNRLYDFIVQNSSLHILENKMNARATPFSSFQDELKSKGKRMCVDTLSIMMKRLIKPDPIMKDKDLQVDFNCVIETELRELKVMYEHLEDQIKAKDMLLGRLQDQVKNQAKEKNDLQDIISNLQEKQDEHDSKVKTLQEEFKKKIKIMNELSKDLLELQRKLEMKTMQIQRRELDLKELREKSRQEIEEFKLKIKKLGNQLHVKNAALTKVKEDTEILKKKLADKEPSESSFDWDLIRKKPVEEGIQTDMTSAQIVDMLKEIDRGITEKYQSPKGLKNADKSDASSREDFSSTKILDRGFTKTFSEKPDCIDKSIQVDNIMQHSLQRNDVDISSRQQLNHFYDTEERSSDAHAKSSESDRSPNRITVNYREKKRNDEDQKSVSSVYTPPKITSNDRRNMDIIKKYEHKFRKTSDKRCNYSPAKFTFKTIEHHSYPKKKSEIKGEPLSDYISSKTAFFRTGGSPKQKRGQMFSPILKRNCSMMPTKKFIIKAMVETHSLDQKQFVALSGKMLEFNKP